MSRTYLFTKVFLLISTIYLTHHVIRQPCFSVGWNLLCGFVCEWPLGWFVCGLHYSSVCLCKGMCECDGVCVCVRNTTALCHNLSCSCKYDSDPYKTVDNYIRSCNPTRLVHIPGLTIAYVEKYLRSNVFMYPCFQLRAISINLILRVFLRLGKCIKFFCTVGGRFRCIKYLKMMPTYIEHNTYINFLALCLISLDSSTRIYF